MAAEVCPDWMQHSGDKLEHLCASLLHKQHKNLRSSCWCAHKGISTEDLELLPKHCNSSQRLHSRCVEGTDGLLNDEQTALSRYCSIFVEKVSVGLCDVDASLISQLLEPFWIDDAP